MMRSLLLAMLSLSLVLPAQAAGPTTIGYVDMQKVLEESKLGKRLQEELRGQFEPRGKALAEEEQEIRQLQQNLARDKPLMSKDQVEKKEKEIQTRIEGYQKKAGALQQELMKVQQEKGREIIGPAREAVTSVAKKKKVGMVIDRAQAGLVYIDASLEITADVIKQLDAAAK